MPISSTQRKVGPTPGNGVAVDFPFNFKVFAPTDLEVIRTSANGGDTTLSYGSGYSVALNADQDANPGGVVRLPVALAADLSLTIVSAVPMTQESDWQNQGGFLPAVLTEDLDRQTAVAQQLAEGLGRAIQAPATSAPLTMAKPVGNRLLGWSEDGTRIVNIDPADLAGFAAYGETVTDVFTGDGVETVFELSFSAGAESNVFVAMAGVVQVPGEDYAWLGANQIEFDEAPADGIKFMVRYQRALENLGGQMQTDGSNAAPNFPEVVGVARIEDLEGKAEVNLDNAVLDGSPIQVNTSGPQVTDGIFGAYVQVENTSSDRGYGGWRLDYIKKGAVLNGNDISSTQIVRYDDVRSGAGWGYWDVFQSPLPFGSGYPNAPTSAQAYGLVVREINPQNRQGDWGGWRAETRSYPVPVAGYQFVPETQDFTGTLGNVRIGYEVMANLIATKSPYCDTIRDRHAQTGTHVLICPNAIAPLGYGTFMTGHRPFVVGLTLSSGGTGYAAGQIITANSGIFGYENEDFSVRVLSVNGSGTILTYELWTAGSYQASFANPVSMAGGTGTGASFGYTLSLALDEEPRGWGGAGGDFWHGFDGLNPEAGKAHFYRGFAVLANGEYFAVSRNAADTTDVPLLRVKANDRIEVAGRENLAPFSFTPTISAETGSITSLSSVSGRAWIVGGIMTVNAKFTVSNAGTGGQALNVYLPSTFTALQGAVVSAIRVDNAQALAGYVGDGSNLIRVVKHDGTNPIATGATIFVNVSFEL